MGVVNRCRGLRWYRASGDSKGVAIPYVPQHVFVTALGSVFVFAYVRARRVFDVGADQTDSYRK